LDFFKYQPGGFVRLGQAENISRELLKFELLQ
jgi:hypothetical protein